MIPTLEKLKKIKLLTGHTISETLKAGALSIPLLLYAHTDLRVVHPSSPHTLDIHHLPDNS